MWSYEEDIMKHYNDDDDKAGAVIWLVAALMATLFMLIAEA